MTAYFLDAATTIQRSDKLQFEHLKTKNPAVLMDRRVKFYFFFSAFPLAIIRQAHKNRLSTQYWPQTMGDETMTSI